MNKYQLTLSHIDDLEAEDEQDAVRLYFELIQDNTDLANFITENLKIDKALLASQLSEKALDEVLEKFAYINVEDTQWAERGDTRLFDVDKLGLEIDVNQMSWQLDYPHRQLYFTTSHDGSGNRELGIGISDINKLVRNLKKDLKLSEKIARAMRNGEIELSFDTRYFGGGDGKTYFNFEDNTKNQITDEVSELDESLQDWFEDNVVNCILSKLQEEYDYLTSKEAVIETLDANEFLFTEDGRQL
jgi:hypothetical protein